MLHARTEAYMEAFAAAFRRVKAVKDEREPTSGFTGAGMLHCPCAGSPSALAVVSKQGR